MTGGVYGDICGDRDGCGDLKRDVDGVSDRGVGVSRP